MLVNIKNWGSTTLNLLSHDMSYFISSIDPSDVKSSELQKLVRNHWQIENSLHFVKDRWWDEDRHDLSRPGLVSIPAFVAWR